jgi:2-polyprenyl-3-methyl-5-hydroxy-6-metoxy-1,4-benzoquinol methylase
MDELSAAPDFSPMAFDERERCALCGSEERSVHRAFREIPVVRCSQCGFLYSSRIMNEETMRAYYRENFGSLRHMQGQMVNARTNRVVLEKLLGLKKIRTWLDVGTGYGFLLKQLNDRWKIKAAGLEVSTQEAEYGRQRMGLEIYPGFESIPAGTSFDIVSSFEVIEHIPDPKPFVHRLAMYVRPGGYLVLMTDNFESTAARRLKGSFPKWIPHTHVSHFGPESLRDCIKSVAELKLVQEASYTPWDVAGRQAVSIFRPPVDDAHAYDVQQVLSSEMRRKYKLYRLRSMLNPLWARLAFRRSLDGGALMYAVCRKES